MSCYLVGHFHVLQFHVCSIGDTTYKALRVLQFHVLHFHVLLFGRPFSCPAISCPATWSVNFMSCNFMSVIFSASPPHWMTSNLLCFNSAKTEFPLSPGSDAYAVSHFPPLHIGLQLRIAYCISTIPVWCRIFQSSIFLSRIFSVPLSKLFDNFSRHAAN